MFKGSKDDDDGVIGKLILKLRSSYYGLKSRSGVLGKKASLSRERGVSTLYSSFCLSEVGFHDRLPKLRPIVDAYAAMAEKMKAMEHQMFKLSVNLQGEDDNDTGGLRVRSKRPGQWCSNDIKVEIPEYDGKLDPDKFVEWLRTV
nr:hypothetical protein CTI12_AA486490 [Tanacetum cinerariifolium]